MVAAWYFDDAAPGDQRAPHQYSPNKPVTLEQLKELGVEYYHVDVTKEGHMDEIEKMCLERNYQNRDLIAISKDTLPNYEAKIKTFFEEHIHEDEEIRFILDGQGYFDVRDKQDRWIRIQVEKSDLIIVPAGIYHRFTLDETNWIKAMRLFALEPKWTPINRAAEGTDENPFRKEFLAKYVKAA